MACMVSSVSWMVFMCGYFPTISVARDHKRATTGKCILHLKLYNFKFKNIHYYFSSVFINCDTMVLSIQFLQCPFSLGYFRNINGLSEVWVLWWSVNWLTLERYRSKSPTVPVPWLHLESRYKYLKKINGSSFFSYTGWDMEEKTSSSTLKLKTYKFIIF